MPREIEYPTVNEHGEDVHPAFGNVEVVKGHATPGNALFGSDIRHGTTIRLRIARASRKRSLNSDRTSAIGRETLAEIEMSMAQWAALVSSIGDGGGVDCTVRRTQTEVQVADLPYEPRLAISMSETRGAADRAFEAIKEARDAYEKALADKAPAKERAAALSNLHHVIDNATPNVTFATKRLVEASEDVVQKAKADIEDIVGQAADRRGLPRAEAPSFTLGGSDSRVIEG